VAVGDGEPVGDVAGSDADVEGVQAASNRHTTAARSNRYKCDTEYLLVLSARMNSFADK
jgi:hypothetical protein